MSSPQPTVDKKSCDAEIEPSVGCGEGTVDRLIEAAKRFVELGDAGPVFLTCESGGERGSIVVLKCNDLSHAQAVHRAIIDIVHAVRQS